MMESNSATTSTSSLRTLGCISLGPMDYVQVPQMVSNLIFSYEVLEFIPPVTALRIRYSRDVGGAIASKN